MKGFIMLRLFSFPTALVALSWPTTATAMDWCHVYPPVIYYQPVCSYPVLPVYWLPCCPPATATVKPASDTPTVVPERMDPPKVDEPKPNMATPREAQSPEKPKLQPANPEIPPLTIPKQELPVEPKPETPAPQPQPKPATPEPAPKLPGFELPVIPEKKPKSPGADLQLPEPPTATLPKLELPGLELPNQNAPIKPVAAELPALPKLELPGLDSPAAQPVEAKKQIVNASPLSAKANAGQYDIFPVEGEAPKSPTAPRAIGFVNKSERDILLTVEGQSVVLPAKTIIRTPLPPKFTWQLGGDTEHTEIVPSQASGLDIVIRK